MPPPNVVWSKHIGLMFSIFILFVLCVIACIMNETLLTMISCKVFDRFHKTYINDALWDRDECFSFGVKRSKVKVTVK